MKYSVSLAVVLSCLAVPVYAMQTVTPAETSRSVSSGDSVNFVPVYTASAPENGLETGLGIRVHFNSNAVQFTGVTGAFAYGVQPVGESTADTSNFDADPLTDRYVILSWLDITAQWPGTDELPLTLGTVSFGVKSGFSGTTYLRTTATDTADGGTFQSTPMTLESATTTPPTLNVRGLLQGAYAATDGRMKDGLRVAGLIPTTQPYASLGHTGNETTTTTILNTTGNDAPVDWVLVELRDKADAKTRIASKAALLQRDGDVVDAATGSNTLSFAGVAAGNYYIALHHRNHLSTMSVAPITLSATATLLDFTQATTKLYGSESRMAQGSVMLLPTGDANHDRKLIADGPGNDRNTVLGTVLSNPANTGMQTNFQLHGYYASDLNLDGKTLYAGPDNDVNALLGNILLWPGNGTISTNFILLDGLPK